MERGLVGGDGEVGWSWVWPWGLSFVGGARRWGFLLSLRSRVGMTASLMRSRVIGSSDRASQQPVADA